MIPARIRLTAMDTGTDFVTITLNPAVDRTIFLDHLCVGQVNRATRHHLQPGGKGVNVSSMLAQYGVPNTASGFLGTDNASLFEALFRQRGIRDAFVRIPGETRTGIKIIDESLRETTDINSPGLAISTGDFQTLEGILRRLIQPGRWFVLAGSAPPGLGPSHFGAIIRSIKAGGAHVAVDSSGETLTEALRSGADLVKPNQHELAEQVGCDPADPAACIAAAHQLQRSSVPNVILSLGAAGAVFLTPDGAVRAIPPPTRVVSSVGAGDSLLAGYLAGIATKMALPDRARLAGAFAQAAISRLERTLPPAAELDDWMRAMEIHPL